jgi:hypothetical protein
MNLHNINNYMKKMAVYLCDQKTINYYNENKSCNIRSHFKRFPSSDDYLTILIPVQLSMIITFAYQSVCI